MFVVADSLGHLVEGGLLLETGHEVAAEHFAFDAAKKTGGSREARSGPSWFIIGFEVSHFGDWWP